MMKVAFLVSTLAVTAHSATKVAVLEFGKSGVVRRTTSTRTVTTFSGVVSFLGALHGQRQLQQAGMPLVPDLFNKPDHALIVGISGVDLASMPALSNIVENQAVGHMDVDGSHCNGMLNKFGPPQETSVNNLVVDAKAKLTETGLKSMSLTVTDSDAAAVEAQIQTLIASLKEQSTDGKSRVVHFVLEEKDGESHRRLDSRELASGKFLLEIEQAFLGCSTVLFELGKLTGLYYHPQQRLADTTTDMDTTTITEFGSPPTRPCSKFNISTLFCGRRLFWFLFSFPLFT